MVRWLGILARTLASTIRTQRELALENLALRQQVAVWKVRPPRPQLTARDLSSAVRAGGVEPRAAPAAAFQYHGASDRRVDGATSDRGVRAGGPPSVSDPGSGTRSMANDFRVRPGCWTSGRRSQRHDRRGKTPMPSA